MASFLEPIAVKKASLITGVAEGYYQGVIERNEALSRTCVFGAMPYGGESEDHEKVRTLGLKSYLFEKREGKLQLIYAGAMLPKAYAPLEAVMQAIAADPALFGNLEIHFIGTGKSLTDPEGYRIRPLAEKYGLWNERIFEYPARIPYLDVLIHLESASGAFILGSTEPHYTPSKVYQAVLSGKPILALLHSRSTAGEVVRQAGAGVVLAFDGEEGVKGICCEFPKIYREYVRFARDFRPEQIDHHLFEQFSARAVTGKLAGLLNRAAG